MNHCVAADFQMLDFGALATKDIVNLWKNIVSLKWLVMQSTIHRRRLEQ